MNLIVLPIVLVLVVIIISLAPKFSNKLMPLLTWRKSAIIAGVYLFVLVLSAAMTAALPNTGFWLSEGNDGTGNLQSGNVSTNFFTIRNLKDFEHQPGLHLRSQQIFKMAQGTLKLGYESNSVNFQVYIERKNVDDGKIDVLTYSTPYYAGYIDYTNLLLPPRVSFQEGILLIESTHQTLNLKLFKPNFTQTQFERKNAVSLQDPLRSMNFGRDEVLIRVPKSLKIDQGQNYVQYLDKS